MSDLVNHLQEHGSQSTVNEFVNGSGQIHRSLIQLPLHREHIQLIFTFKIVEYALGAGDRQFESGHPDFLSVKLSNCLNYGHDVFQRCFRLDIMDRVKDKSAVL